MWNSGVIRWIQRPAVWAVGGAVVLLVWVSWRQWQAMAALPAEVLMDPPMPREDVAVVLPDLMSDFDPFSRREQPRQIAQPTTVARQSHGLELEGVLHLPERDGGVAILRKGDLVKAVPPGGRVNGVELVEIHADRVVLSNAGHREALALCERSVDSGGRPPARHTRRFARNHQQALDFD